MTLEQAKKVLRQSSDIYFYEGHGVWVGDDDGDENDPNNMKPTIGIDGQLSVQEIQALAVIVTAEGVNFSLAEKVEA